jgi:hypothetical protein
VSESAPGGEAHRRLLLLGLGLLCVGLAAQFAVDLLWPDVGLPTLLAVLYPLAKWAGDRLARSLFPRAAHLGAWGEWARWLQVSLPCALLQEALLALGLGAARGWAAAFPCALYVADVGWLRGGGQDGDRDSLGRRLAAWP